MFTQAIAQRAITQFAMTKEKPTPFVIVRWERIEQFDESLSLGRTYFGLCFPCQNNEDAVSELASVNSGNISSDYDRLW